MDLKYELQSMLRLGLYGAISKADWTKPSVQDPSVPHAPKRASLSKEDRRLAIANALRYIPEEYHQQAAHRFAQELDDFGHIYMYSLRPTLPMKAYPFSWYPTKNPHSAAILVMLMNNLDPAVAQFPHELVTYGGNGSVLSHWGQFHLLVGYLLEMSFEQTLVMYSGHPLGLFPSKPQAPRMVITNGLTVPNYSKPENYNRMYGLGVSIYGQMTAGSYCYIGPQGIVHGTTLTLLNAGRKYLGLEDLRGKVFLTSGLGGMSGAQPKAGTICNSICVVAEINEKALKKRYEQKWVDRICNSTKECLEMVKKARKEREVVSIGFLGNVVDLWEMFANEEEMLVDLGSDQTSCHNPYNGGYYPVGLTFDESNDLMVQNPELFKQKVQESLRRQIQAIDKLAKKGLRFWDYGNSFLLECSRAGADVSGSEKDSFKYPSYVQDIMGDIFSLGFGPFRWVCTSGDSKDLQITDHIATEVIQELMKDSPPNVLAQFKDNLLWIQKAEENKLVVGSQARILYSDQIGRVQIALRMNKAVKEGHISAPVVISRDHHDVSGTDSPWRETSNIRDGSMFCADMSVQNFVGDSFRGATWVALHNGGGTGWGEAMNGGFGLVLDGSDEAAQKAESMLNWDVSNGVARRSWSGNPNAEQTIKRAMEIDPLLKVTLPHHVNNDLLTKF